MNPQTWTIDQWAEVVSTAATLIGLGIAYAGYRQKRRGDPRAHPQPAGSDLEQAPSPAASPAAASPAGSPPLRLVPAQTDPAATQPPASGPTWDGWAALGIAALGIAALFIGVGIWRGDLFAPTQQGGFGVVLLGAGYGAWRLRRAWVRRHPYSRWAGIGPVAMGAVLLAIAVPSIVLDWIYPGSMIPGHVFIVELTGLGFVFYGLHRRKTRRPPP